MIVEAKQAGGRTLHRAIFCGIFLFPFIYWIGCELIYAKRCAPGGMKTIGDYRQKFGEPKWARVFQHNDMVFYHLPGRLPPTWMAAFPSSVPIYIFDEKGQLVDWCGDPGDNSAFQIEWPNKSAGKLEGEAIKQVFLH